MVSSEDILNGKILVVDDQEATARSVAEMLRDAGYGAVTFTTTPREVGELHRKNRYDLILLDLEMPEVNGFDVMEELRTIETDAYPPVIAMTIQPSYKLHALKAGAKDFIAKPFDPDEALARIRNMLEVRLLHGEARNTARALESMALHDPLTGVANRHLLTDRISAALANARRTRGSMAIVYLDLDGFKQINDTLGHAAGDTVLRMVASRLTSAVREEDTVARLGGDEFVIALWNAGTVFDVTTVASKLLRLVSKPYVVDGQALTMTASAGVGIYPRHGVDAKTLMERADKALYAAKRAGKNVFRIGEQPDRRC